MSLLLSESPRVFQPTLAKKLGLNEAILLQQIHYWLCQNRLKPSHNRDGCVWTYNGYEDWQLEHPWWSLATIRRTFGKLERERILMSRQYEKSKGDCRKWYTINYNRVKALEHPTPSAQNEQTLDANIGDPLAAKMSTGSVQSGQTPLVDLSGSSITETSAETSHRQVAAKGGNKLDGGSSGVSDPGDDPAAAANNQAKMEEIVVLGRRIGFNPMRLPAKFCNYERIKTVCLALISRGETDAGGVAHFLCTHPDEPLTTRSKASGKVIIKHRADGLHPEDVKGRDIVNAASDGQVDAWLKEAVEFYGQKQMPKAVEALSDPPPRQNAVFWHWVARNKSGRT